MICRIILKIKGKASEQLKQAIKSIDGYWDDLFDAWSLPMESSIHIKPLMEGIIYEAREFKLPKEHVNIKPKVRAMYGKYAILTQKLINEEQKLIGEITQYEKGNVRTLGKAQDGSAIYDIPWSYQMYQDEPSDQGKPYSAYLIEKKFHSRLLEIKNLRSEIEQIHHELNDFEAIKKG